MNYRKSEENVCRICLDGSATLNWNTTVYGYIDVTYKDCFYKYTQLECLAPDPFSELLCQSCVNGLNNVHILISTALESHNYLQTTNLSNSKVNDFVNAKECTEYITEFEIVLLDKREEQPIICNRLVYENIDEVSNTKPVSTKVVNSSKLFRDGISVTAKQEKYKNKVEQSIKSQKKIMENKMIGSDVKYFNSKCKQAQSSNVSYKISQRKIKDQRNNSIEKILDDGKTCEIKNEIDVLGDKQLDDIKNSSEHTEPNVIKKNREVKQPRMCSICSKILIGESAVQMHEETHRDKRERKETCKVCGLKFYDKRSLYCHMLVHKENRKKNHKCEFCDKAFYYKGDLNVHRRIHLGQMISCSLCTKQFLRQIDLQKHMNSHSATAINANMKKRSRYLVRCKHCDKCILSTSFKSHTAAHLNEPLMKCSICSKEFFHRNSCVLHVKKVHQKGSEEYNDFIIQYKKNRMSHLFLEQKADIQFIDE